GNFSIYYNFTSGNNNDKKVYLKILAQDFDGDNVVVMKGLSDLVFDGDWVTASNEDLVLSAIHYNADKKLKQNLSSHSFGEVPVSDKLELLIFHWANRAWQYAKQTFSSDQSISWKTIYISYRYGDSYKGWYYHNHHNNGNDILHEDIYFYPGLWGAQSERLNIVLGEDRVSDWDNENTIYHEVGHAIVFTLQNFNMAPNSGGKHLPELNGTNAAQAFNEGLANAYSFIVDSRYFEDDNEATIYEYRSSQFHPVYSKIVGNAHPLVNEMTIGTALFDLWDDKDNPYLNLNTKLTENTINDVEFAGGEYCSLSTRDILIILRDYYLANNETVTDVVQFFNLLTEAYCNEADEIAQVFNINMRNVNYTGSAPEFSIQNFATDDIRDYSDQTWDLTFMPYDGTVPITHEFEPFLNIDNTWSGSSDDYNLGSNNKLILTVAEDISLTNGTTFSFVKNTTLNRETGVTPTQNLHNDVYICNCEIGVDASTIELGTDDYCTSTTYVQGGAVLNFDYGGTSTTHLIINKGSKLVISADGELKIGKGLEITIKEGAELIIEGTLSLAEDAIFSFTGSSTSNTMGKVIFNSPVPKNIKFGNNAKIELKG
ncbi:MAG: hypothetical protein KDC92_17545, partial [Bacteroidetes bacterium]|nr:hypothetical protein [Bacteroidota bacterium]